jgi:hypothetical protein
MRIGFGIALTIASVCSSMSVALAQTPAAYPPPPGASPPPLPPLPPPEAPPVAEKKLGVGYKLGNGLGFVGADIIVAPIEHLAVDLQVNYESFSEPNGSATGVGFAPSIQGRLNGSQLSTPYLGVGWVHASLSLQNVSASVSGFFANAGYEWRWDSGLGILLGGGVAHLGAVHATDGVTTITRNGGWFPNLEFGVRYMFL